MSGDNQVIYGDALEELRQLPDATVQSCVTSPPYYWKKDYRVAGQIGMEANLDDYLGKLRAVFRQVWRVLREDGTLWLNIGDSYTPTGGGGIAEGGKWARWSEWKNPGKDRKQPPRSSFAPKQRLLVPFRLAIGLQEDGWLVRSSIIWSKNRPMPESVKDRPTMAHEHIFLLAKQAKYAYYKDAVLQPCAPSYLERVKRPYQGNRRRGYANCEKDHLDQFANSDKAREDAERGRNLWDVWEMSTASTKGNHFAPFPGRLVETCILAGTKEGDVVLDPFLGTGTTARVAQKLQRRWIGIEINREYEPYINEAIKQPSLEVA